jgi:hypothetical protein
MIMKQRTLDNPALNTDPHSPEALLTVLCYLMTSYATRPCLHKACAIEKHIGMLLNSRAGDELGHWSTVFEKLQWQWNALSRCHVRATAAESKNTIAH